MKKSEEIPSWCLGTNSYQGREGGLASTCQGKGAPQLHPEVPTPPPHPSPLPCPPPTHGPGGPSWPKPRARESQRVAVHPGQGLLCPPPAPHPAPLPETRPVPPPCRPGYGPAPRVPASPGPEACGAAPASAPPAPAPTRPGTYPQKPQGQRGGRLGALLRSLPASPMVLGGGGARRRQRWRRLGLGPARRRRRRRLRRRRRGARGGGRGRERARGRARVRGWEPGFQAGQLEAGRTTRPAEMGGAGGGAERRGRVAEEEGRAGEPRTAREEGRPDALGSSHRRSQPDRCPARRRWEGPEAPAGSGVAAAAVKPRAPLAPSRSPPPKAALTGQWPLRPLPSSHTPPKESQWSRPGEPPPKPSS